MFRLNTITYGTASDPYLAVRTIQQLTEDEGTPYPFSEEFTGRLLYGRRVYRSWQSRRSHRVRKSVNPIKQIRRIPLKKWSSNDSRVMRNLHVTYDKERVRLDTNSSKRVLEIE